MSVTIWKVMYLGNPLQQPQLYFSLTGNTAPIIPFENFVKNYPMKPLDVTAGLWSVTHWGLNWAINKGTLKACQRGWEVSCQAGEIYGYNTNALVIHNMPMMRPSI